MKNKVGISLLVLIISGCLLISAVLIVGGYLLLRAQKNYTPPTQQAISTTTSAPAMSGTPAEAGTLSPEISSQMDQIQQQVETIRGLSLKTDLQRALMTPDELKDKVVNDFFKDYTAEDAASDVRVLSTLGLLEAGFDLHQFYLDLYSEQVAGYYDQDTKEMYVITGEQFGGMERMTYAHEFTHALQDQNYDLKNGLKLDNDYCKTDTEYCAAATALIEGDATLSETQWFINDGTSQDRKDLLSFQENYKSPVYDSAPAYMQKDFIFPYDQGYTFAEGLYNKGGFQAVDDALRNPPVSTEQILHPEKYPSDKPVKVEMPDLLSALGSGWEELDNNQMGEWYTYLILSSGRSSQFRLEDSTAADAAAGWGGDTYVYEYSKDLNEYLLAWHSVWDTQTDAVEFFNASRDYGKARWGTPVQENSSSVTWTSNTDGKITMRRSGDGVLWLMSSNDALSSQALTLITGFGN